MASTDKAAGRLIRELRRDRGHSPEQLSHEMFAAGLGYVSGRTIRRIEDPKIAKIPTVRVQFALAKFFDRLPSQIWVSRAGQPARRRVAA